MKDWPFGLKLACEAPRNVGSKQSISIQRQCTDYNYARPFIRGHYPPKLLAVTIEGSGKLYGRAKWHARLHARQRAAAVLFY